MLSQDRVRANEVDEPTAGQRNVVQRSSETNAVGHDGQTREPLHEVAQMIQVHGQATEKDVTGGESAGGFCACAVRHTHRRYQ